MPGEAPEELTDDAALAELAHGFNAMAAALVQPLPPFEDDPTEPDERADDAHDRPVVGALRDGRVETFIRIEELVLPSTASMT